MDTPSPSPPEADLPHLDLRGTPCPLNFIRSRLALESVPMGGRLQIDLDCGEPEEMVSSGLRQAGHSVVSTSPAGPEAGWVRLQVCRA